MFKQTDTQRDRQNERGTGMMNQSVTDRQDTPLFVHFSDVSSM